MREVSLISTNSIYNEITTWWTERGFPIVDRVLLPETALVVECNDTLLAILFIYNTDSAVVWLAYPTTNPFVTKEKREGALDYLIESVDTFIQNKFIFTTSGTTPVMKSLLNNGFTEGDTETTHFIKIT